MKLGKRTVEQLRGMNQAELARICGVTRQYINQCLRLAEIPDKHIRKIQRAYKNLAVISIRKVK